jgi:hypothetical protein
MPDLGIPYDLLEDFADTLESIRNRMNATGQTFDNYDEDVGDDEVRDKLNDFVDNWRDGRDEIDGQLTAMKEISLGTVQVFQDLDTEHADQLRENSGGGDGGGGDSQPA